MVFHIITIFPNSFLSYFSSSIMKRAQEKWEFRYVLYDLSDFSLKRTRRVDDKPFWWMPWRIISPEPLYSAIDSIVWNNKEDFEIIYLSPRWDKLTQGTLEKFAKNPKDHILICGHYEWIDERIIEIFGIQQISIWDYVLTSWELACMVFIDWIVRLLPWVISEESLIEESFSDALNWLKEYPQYTRPANFKWKMVPEELLSWDPKLIKNWKKANSKL